MNINPFQDMRAVILRFIINDNLSEQYQEQPVGAGWTA